MTRTLSLLFLASVQDIYDTKMSSANLSQRCILAVGNTGNGKSFTATIFGAENVKVGHSTKSETKAITFYPIKKGGFYIDTPGFDDSDEDRKDDETVRSIFLKMMEKNIQNITTILWFVVPEDRAKASYKRQAKFIESLAKDYKGNVWDNTIIVTKGDKFRDGPREAAREIAKIVQKGNNKNDILSKTRDFKILLFEKLDPGSIYFDVETSDKLNHYGIFKESEPERILSRYESLMEGHLERPIGLNIRKVKCSKCPEETDPRLASPGCHSEIELFHPNTECIHRGNIIDIHPSSSRYKHSDYFVAARTVEDFHHCPTAWALRVATVGLVDFTSPRMEPGYWKCCRNNDANSRGCKQVYRCCENDLQSTGCQKIYSECSHKREDSPCLTICKGCKKISGTEGCKKRCKKCGNDPRNKKGCSVEVPHNFN